MYNFEKLLKQNKLSAEGPSTGTKRKIAQFRALETKIANAQNHITTVKSERKKLELQNEIQEAQDALQEMDVEICDAINKFVKNKDVYAANAERLKASRGAKTSAPAGADADPKPDPAPAADPKPDPKPDPNPDPVEVKNSDPDPKPTPKPADPAPQQTENKKSSSAFGWVAAAIGIVVAVIVGKNVIENR